MVLMARVMVLSHWPHVAEQVQQQLQQLVEQHVASVEAPLQTIKGIDAKTFFYVFKRLFKN